MSIMQRRSGRLPAEDPHAFRLVIEPAGTVTVVAVHGELDIATVDGLRSALIAAIADRAQALVVDLAGATFVDSVGVGAILHAKHRLGTDGRLAVVVAPDSYARVIFEVVGVDAVLEVFPTRAAAIEHLSA
jgi:anti-anti-sigma factor